MLPNHQELEATRIRSTVPRVSAVLLPMVLAQSILAYNLTLSVMRHHSDLPALLYYGTFVIAWGIPVLSLADIGLRRSRGHGLSFLCRGLISRLQDPYAKSGMSEGTATWNSEKKREL